MSLPEFSVKKPVTILMFAAGVILLGVISWSRLSQELFPPITYPQITVVSTYENAAPEEIEALITRPIEESVSAASNIRKVSSTSREGTSIVICEFNWNTNMDFAALNVREKVDLIKEKLPRDAEEPIVMKYNPFDSPIMILSVTSETGAVSPYELREISRRVIKDEIEKIEGVAQLVMVGGREREIVVELNQERLRAFSISISDIIELIKQANLNYPAGTIETSFYEYLVRTIGEFKTVTEMYDVPLLIKDRSEEEEQGQKEQLTEEEKERKKKVIYIRELGMVKDTLKDRASISRYNGLDNVSLSVQRQADSNTLAVNKIIYEKLKILRETLPDDVAIKVVYDQSVFISRSINELRDNALQGGILAFFILLIFLRNLRSAFVVTVGIPICILFTLILMFFSKLSLNMMSLGGLALGVGMLVDNGIVVIENIYRHRQVKDDPKIAAIDASNEVFSAVVGSTLTTVAVFFPLVFVVGIAGQLFKELALTVTFSLVASVITAMSLTPMFMSRGRAKKINIVLDEEKIIAERKQQQDKEGKFKGPIPYLVVIAIILSTLAVAGLSLKLLLSLDQEFMPKLDQRQFMIKVNMPAGSNLEATNLVIQKIEDRILSFPVVRDVTVNIGSSKESKMAGSVEVLGTNQANIIINLHSRPPKGIMNIFREAQPTDYERDISTAEFIQKLKDSLENIELENANLDYILQESVFKSVFAGSAPLVIILRGFDLENILIPAAKEVENQLGKVEGVYGIKNSLSPPSPEVKINIRKDRASLYQLTVNQVAAVAQAAIRGYVASKFKEEGREIDIRVRLRKEDREDFNKISKLFIFSPLGVSLFLEQVAYLSRGLGPTEIKRENKQRVIFVSANIYNRALNDIVDDVKKTVENIKQELPQNYDIEIGGENKEMEESFKSLKFALLLALILVYMIMASEFESLIQPLIIMFTVPLSLIGVSWMLYSTHTPLSVVVVLGFIMLGGIVVNNGILLIDFINIARKQGLGIFEAAIQSSKVRARPILMTSLTTIFGLLPLAFAVGEGAELRAPMARTVMGGLVTSAFLTLFVVPCIYIIMESIKEAFMRLLKTASAPEEDIVLLKTKKAIIDEIDVGPAGKAGLSASAKKRKAMDAGKQGEESEPYPEQGKDEKDKTPVFTDITKELTQRQIEALDDIRQSGRLTRLEYVVKFKVPLPIADRELEDMVVKGLLWVSGEGPHREYMLKPEAKF
ncbi:MAG: efflux RND transporter permease subunit [Candidatus Omnitrophica bacterium]|nr:efflux RND transporter permease subunit [Candidatus Omnitrophota bacterium]MBU4478545.1 efflux RND transporter permease subunit [Candidatus Omnitrophota bacterium]MCG2702858.1 efflux RND transporter permease subunit [Candidatus Omnitrophota bacterium]